jgi:hypothetical protein
MQVCSSTIHHIYDDTYLKEAPSGKSYINHISLSLVLVVKSKGSGLK